MSSLLEVVSECNCVADVDLLAEREGLYRFIVNGRLVGHISASDISALKSVENERAHAVFKFDTVQRTLSFSEEFSDCGTRSAAVADLLAQMRSEKAWASLSKWRGELYPVYDGAGAVAVMIERAASYNFGIRTFGVHVNGYTRSTTGELRMWVGRRSQLKPTWPGYLDQIAAGGIGDGLGAWESMVKECGEEAGIPPALAQRGRFAGTIQYFTRSDLGLQPETQFVFDLELPSDFVPAPTDGEVDSFLHVTLDEAVGRLRRGEFKPNCGACVIDFLIRHGFVTPDNEPEYLSIVDNLHRPLPHPAPRYS
ncbi:hypothetical protein GGI03_001032 [Coemansia sp. RSA 2337]|nr:hypothetical protein H4S03_005101 [Coemansia sp. S3946]KAJ2048051.1 hypothetical protein H4S04_004061 [Coemansia sp. S16]KAJ2112600.1 hypothetical protein IW146_004494 [Coemansia sp. RSA 922]KAJ2468364.1 hypothetical protein GGI03_001032 [Coemansia sp. RSA 2337]